MKKSGIHYSFAKKCWRFLAEIFISERCKSIFIISFSTSVLFSRRRINVNLVDLVKSFPPSIYLQKSAWMQPRMSLSKFAGRFNSLFIRLLRQEPFVFRSVRPARKLHDDVYHSEGLEVPGIEACFWRDAFCKNGFPTDASSLFRIR